MEGASLLNALYRLNNRANRVRDKNSVRHALSLNICFKKHERSAYEHGKGAYWSVDVTAKAGLQTPQEAKQGQKCVHRSRR